LAFIADDSYIAASYEDCTIRLWNIAEGIEKSKSFMDSFRGCVNLVHFKKTMTASRVNDMRSSKDGQYLHTNIGTIFFQDLLSGNKNGMFWSDGLQELWVDDQWISYGGTPFLRIPGDCGLLNSRVRGDKVAIALRGDRILILDIDRECLRFLLGRIAK